MTAIFVISLLALTSCAASVDDARERQDPVPVPVAASAADAEAPRVPTLAPGSEGDEDRVVVPATRVAALPDFTGLAADVTPSVVNISTTTTVPVRRQQAPRRPFPQQDPFWEPFERFFGPGPSPAPRQGRSLGSGFLIDEDGHILTNNHVVENADQVLVTFPGDSREYSAEVVGTDPMTDIALIRVEGRSDARPVTLGTAEDLAVGAWVVAIGNPFGLGSTVTAGIVSAKGRRLGVSRYDDFIQTDASINPGNSGGPLIDLTGTVVGINTAIFSRGGGNIGIGFAIPIDLARDVVEQLKEHGRVSRGFLGVMVQPIDSDMADALGVDRARGALVADVSAGSPAAAGDIRAGDVILEFGGQKIRDPNDLTMAVARTRPGATVELTVSRDGRRRALEVELGELDGGGRPVESRRQTPGELGLSVAEIDAELARRLGMQSPEGVVVTEVEQGSVGARVGLRAGDVILRVGQAPIRTLKDYEEAIGRAQEGRSLLFHVRRGDSNLFFALRR